MHYHKLDKWQHLTGIGCLVESDCEVFFLHSSINTCHPLIFVQEYSMCCKMGCNGLVLTLTACPSEAIVLTDWIFATSHILPGPVLWCVSKCVVIVI